MADWARSHGLDPSGNGAFSADPDGDGYSNGAEFAFGASPVAAGSSLQQSRISGGLLIISYLARQIGFTYSVQTSGNLGNGFGPASGITPLPSVSQDGVPAGWTRMEFSVPIGGDAFYRVAAIPN
jgi:hypothetical protein